MSKIKLKGKEYATGEILNVSFKDGKFLECVAHVDKNTLFICNNSPNYSGGSPETKHGKRYAYPINIKNGKTSSMDENIIILKKEEKFLNFKLSDRINRFFDTYYKDYKFLFSLESDVLANYEFINEPKKDLTEIKDGYVILHSKERKKMLKIRLGRLMRKLITKYNEKNGKEAGTILPINDEFIEKLHNSWVAYINEVTFEFAVGKDILKGYTTDNYHKKGTLSSCMNNAFDRLKFYTEYPEKIKLLILYYQGQVAGRSLVWTCDDGKIYHDRIYVAFDWVRNSMLEIFKKEGIKNAYGAALSLKVSIPKLTTSTNLPYLDTFRQKNYDKKYLST